MNSTKRQQASAPAHNPERGAKVIARALEIMKIGCRGWSEALSRAEKEVTQ